jgi:hypothetical protein
VRCQFDLLNGALKLAYVSFLLEERQRLSDVAKRVWLHAILRIWALQELTEGPEKMAAKRRETTQRMIARIRFEAGKPDSTTNEHK